MSKQEETRELLDKSLHVACTFSKRKKISEKGGESEGSLIYSKIYGEERKSLK